MIQLRIISTPENLERLRGSAPQLIEALTSKMNELMFRLQSKIVGEAIPSFFPNGAPNIAATVRAIPATQQGTVIHGEVQYGGPRTTKVTLKSGVEVDYSEVQHQGISHSYPIEPFNKKALAFLLDGKKVIVRSVLHPGLKPRPFATSSLEQMEGQIVAELNAEVNALIQ